MELGAEFTPALTARKRGFADKAKLVFARQFFPKIAMHDAIYWVDRLKESDAVITAPGAPGSGFAPVSIPFRLCMAQNATEGGRQIYGGYHWVDQLLPLGSAI